MKHANTLLLLTTLLLAAGCGQQPQGVHGHDGHSHAHDGHSHGEHTQHDGDKRATKEQAGPNGGRIITEVQPNFEFFVQEDRHVRISFLSSPTQIIPPGPQRILLNAGERSKPTVLQFERNGNHLLSSGTLPEGKNFPAVLEVRMAPAASPTYVRFNINLSDCSSCE